MKYLKVWVTFRDIIKPLSEAEKGRLFDAMLLYADNGEEPAEMAGNERFIWPVAKQSIDLMVMENQRLTANGKNGGRPRKDNQEKPTETNENQQKPTETQKEKKYKERKDKENKNNLFDRFWAAYPRHIAKQSAQKCFDRLGVDDGLLEIMIQAIERQKRSEQWTKDGGQFIPYPSTWLNGRRWEDDVPVKGVVHAQDFPQRDYSEVDRQIMDGLAAEMAAFKGAM